MTRLAQPSAGRPDRMSTAPGAWYGTNLTFQAVLLRDTDTHDEHAGRITSSLRQTRRRVSRDRVWTFTHDGMNVPGRDDAVPVTVEFHESPGYATYGLEPWEFPLIFADPGADSPHRHQDVDALCLWFPGDPDDRRWHHTDGLVALFNLARNHLFFETYWRATGGHGGAGSREGIWLGDEAAHGYLDALAEVS